MSVRRDIDYDQLVRDLIPLMRGSYSQGQLCKKMAFTFNQVSKWETGKTRVKWAEFVSLCEVLSIDLEYALKRVFDFSRGASDIHLLLERTASQMSLEKVACHLQLSVRQVRRLFQGDSSLTLSVVLQIIDIATASLLNFLEYLVPVERFHCLESSFRQLEDYRAVNENSPLATLILCALDSPEYLGLDEHDDAVIARRLNLPVEKVAHHMSLFLERGLVVQRNGKLMLAVPHQVDMTAEDISVLLATKRYWLRCIEEEVSKLTGPQEHSKFFDLAFGVSHEGYEKLKLRYRAFVDEFMTIVREDEGHAERIAVISANLIERGESSSYPKL